MSKHLFAVAFALGLAALTWVGLGFGSGSPAALAMTLVIAAVYLAGAGELRQFRLGSAQLAAAAAAACANPPARLADWLVQVPADLRQAVRRRVEGDPVGLPPPALAPYLVGLLVMLGMLGTFLGMVVTFKGTVFALEGSADLQGMRSALAAPIKGLGLAFGTSVAGVAASAMLGLMATIARRERLEVAQRLDAAIATALQPFSRAQQREAGVRAMQAQAAVLPTLVDQLGAMMNRVEQRSEQLDAQLLARQAGFHDEVRLAFTALARSVASDLKESLATGARAVAENTAPVIESAMARVTQDARQLHDHVGEAMRQQGASIAAAFEQRSASLLAAVDERMARAGVEQSALEERRLAHWTATLQASGDALQAHWQRAGDAAVAHQQALCAALERSTGEATAAAARESDRTLQALAQLVARSEELVRARTDNEAGWLQRQAAHMAQLAESWRSGLAELSAGESARGEAAIARLAELEAAVARHLATLGTALEAPITRLLQTASEVPQAAAGVLARLREETDAVAERDKLALQERTTLVRELGELLHGMSRAAADQRTATEALVASASSVLAQAGDRFAQTVDAHSGKAAEMTAHVGGSAVELASLAEAFGHGVSLFQVTNDKLVESLQRIEASLNRATARSDEQLAYYVAQAREVIDLSIASQQGMVENLREIRVKPTLAEAARR